MIDTQLHILDPAGFPYPGETAGYRPKLHESGTLTELLHVMDANEIEKGVLVQASVYGFDNAAILEATQKHPDRFRAVVMSDGVNLKELAGHEGVVGLRLNLIDYRDHGGADQMLDLALRAVDQGLVLQLQAEPETLTRLCRDLPHCVLILDHFGRLDPSQPDEIAKIRALSERPDCYLKASAPFRLAGPEDWRAPNPVLLDLIDAYGPERVLWGSDWPFIKLGGGRPSYAECLAWGRDTLDLEKTSRNAVNIFGWCDG